MNKIRKPYTFSHLKSSELHYKIEKVRSDLYQMIEENTDLQNEKIVHTSEALDALLNIYYRDY